MSRLLLSLFLLSATACVRAPTTPRVPAEQASWFKFPSAFPQEERQSIPGPLAVALSLAMEDFLSRSDPHEHSDVMTACLAQRAAYDVVAFPGPDAQVFVSISLSPGACQEEGPLLDVGATYAVDARQGRILAVRP